MQDANRWVYPDSSPGHIFFCPKKIGHGRKPRVWLLSGTEVKRHAGREPVGLSRFQSWQYFFLSKKNWAWKKAKSLAFVWNRSEAPQKRGYRLDSTSFQNLVKSLVAIGTETEWLELKRNNTNPQEIGQNISALSNSAALLERQSAYILWGI